MIRIFSWLFVSISTLSGARAQVTINPTFFSQDDDITIIYNASEGNGDLEGIEPVYMHTGLITDQSTSPSDWQFVQGMWGIADANVLMTSQGNNIHIKTINIADFYGFSPGTVIEKLAFVFRNADGSLVGRASDGQDIFVSLATDPQSVFISSPTIQPLLITASDMFLFRAEASQVADLEITVDEIQVIASENSTMLETTIDASFYGLGLHWVEFIADFGGAVVSDSIYFIIQEAPLVENPPAGVIDGINYIDDNTVILQLLAPFKDFVYAFGDFSDWLLDPQYSMKKTVSNDRWWVQINNLVAGQEYRFQYYVGSEAIVIADIYSDKILDPWNDPWISNSTYPDLVAYPTETSNAVSVLQTAKTPFNWQNSGYEKPPKQNLIIYELLIRDFTAAHDYNTLIDTLDYLENLGINAIELMPINEFEGNESWGYNPSFYFAPDKYYGTAFACKTFIDECHSRGIAVIMDIALNHSFGQNPQVRLYFDPNAGQFGQPTPQNPWFNETPTHDFNVGYDYNHESLYTQQFVDSVLAYWVTEFDIDGFRLDLSKGFTQNVTIGNVSAWGNYDQSRVNILKRIADELWDVDSETYIILEHFADNSEEKVLSNYGFLLWGNGNYDYNEATMGYSSNMNWQSYQNRGWLNPFLVSYMESHDEERLMFKNELYGNSNGNYNIQNLNTALLRMELANNFFIPIPGPKMIWQFGELGYDYSINTCEDLTINANCRLSPKPIRWDYLTILERKKLYKVIAALNHLKRTEAAFSTSDFNVSLNGYGKTIHLNHIDMNVTIIGNFNVIPINLVPGFQHSGIWYEYFTGTEIQVGNASDPFLLTPGEYRLYTDIQLPLPDLVVIDDTTKYRGEELWLYPNPINEFSELVIDHPGGDLMIEIFDASARKVLKQVEYFDEGLLHIPVNGLIDFPKGVYLIRVQTKTFSGSLRCVVG